VASRSTEDRPNQRATTELFVGVVSVASLCLSVLALPGRRLGMPFSGALGMDRGATHFSSLPELKEAA